MQQLASVWSALDMQRRVVVVLATVAMFAAILFVSRAATAPNLDLLYGGLGQGAAGEIVAALEQRGVIYEVRGDSIFVDAAQRDELRMTLAAEGLPASSGSGYELLDGMSGFGTTSQMFDAAYWRAKEGELARTIVASSPHIRAARVHISNTSAQPFRRDMKPTASVTVTTATGSLSASQAKALKFLVASAVAALQPGDVAVIDGTAGLILDGDEPGAAAATDRAAELKANVERLLAARVGPGNAVVEVSVDTENASESITERTFDPESRVAISTETEETTGSSKNGGSASVTVASNLPTGDAGAGAQTSESQNANSRERVNFEVSETKREVLRAPGDIRRISVAVLVDGVRSADAAGATVWTARGDAELADLRELVASAVGFDEARGDAITLKSLEFQPAAEAGTLVEKSFLGGMAIDVMSLVQLAVLGLVALALGLFVVRPILTSVARPGLAQLAPPGSAPAENTFGDTPVLTGEIDDGLFMADALPVVSGYDGGGLAQTGVVDDADPVARLRRLIDERQDETVQILRNWMEDRKEGAQ